MSIMVNREEAISAINEFIRTNDYGIIGNLFEQLCEYKQVPNSKEEIKAVISNPMILFSIWNLVLVEIETILNIHRLTDKYNQLITVF